MTVVLQFFTLKCLFGMFYETPEQSHRRLTSDLKQLWATILAVLFVSFGCVFILWATPLPLDIQLIILCFILINMLYIFNLFLIFQDSSKSIRWMSVGEQVSPRIVLQEILHTQKESLAKLVHFFLVSALCIGSVLYYFCHNLPFVAICWMVIGAISAYNAIVACFDIAWARSAYTYWNDILASKI